MKATIKIEREIEFDGDFCGAACDYRPCLMGDTCYCRIIGAVVRRDPPSYTGQPRRHARCIAATEGREEGK